MELYLMRHSTSQHQAPTGRDEDRQLTPEGLKLAGRVAAELRTVQAVPNRILTSPLRRCIQTAEVVQKLLRPDVELEVRRELAPAAGASQVLAELMSARAARVLLVGHEPDLSQLVAGLLHSWSRGFAKAMVASLRIDVGEATGDRFAYPDAHLQFLIDPSTLR